MLALFKSHYSIGKSILTLDDPKKQKPKGADSIFSILKENNIKELFLVEDNLTGSFEAIKRCREYNISLRLGLRLAVRNTIDPADENTESKVVVFSINDEGFRSVNKLFSKAFCENSGFVTFQQLKESWNNNMVLVIPFYDSFIYQNNFQFFNCVPDLSFTKPIFFLEDNDVSYDMLLRNKVLEFTNGKYQTLEAKSIYYKSRKDVLAYQTHKLVCSRMMGKERTLQKPELPHCCTAEFSFESWKEKNVKI